MAPAKPWGNLPAHGPMIRSPWKFTGESRAGYYARAAKGIVPPLIRIGDNISATPQSWLNAFIEARAAESGLA